MRAPLYKRGFTLIELLIVIAIIAILAGVVFVALNPLVRFQDARDSRRFADVSAVLSAIRVHQVDNGGNYLTAVENMTASFPYMIGTNAGLSCVSNTPCGVSIADANCIDLSPLVTAGYLGSFPVSPNGAGVWNAGKTGYYIIKNTNNSLTVGACEAEHRSAIAVTR